LKRRPVYNQQIVGLTVLLDEVLHTGVVSSFDAKPLCTGAACLHPENLPFELIERIPMPERVASKNREDDYDECRANSVTWIVRHGLSSRSPGRGA
jgi:hypothetical protein